MMKYLIGELAKKSQVAVDTIRFYEKRGLLQPAKRAENNYRYYDDEALDQLIFIRHCRELGMSLHEIEDLNELRKDPQQQCKVVDQAIEQHLGHINHKIQQFEKFKTQLEQLRARCQSNSNIDDCKIIETLKQHDHLG
ncbi:Cd(II)/Pb(II)-responsive transcriptional regulator [Acinetobacter ursingii]|uniref:Cd(II)/Pb(II)-responsive transcriptional regulator n=1 Tax=Acinetobacter ursingii TaxID=108980 RepID=UPI0032B49D94